MATALNKLKDQTKPHRATDWVVAFCHARRQRIEEALKPLGERTTYVREEVRHTNDNGRV